MEKGEIWIVELPSTIGHEQSGSRSALVFAETGTNVVIILPFTSNLQALRFPYTIEIKPTNENGLSVLSILLVFQIRAIDRVRLKTKIGILEEHIQGKVDTVFKKLFGIF